MSQAAAPTVPSGFVVALRGAIVPQDGTVRREWLIASRWGKNGCFLSVARTLVPAQAEAFAPPNVVPRCSTLAIIRANSAGSNSTSFVFVDERPVGLELVGRFASARGNVWVEGDGRSMRLWGHVHCVGGRSGRHFQFEGTQIAWVGEFIEPRS